MTTSFIDLHRATAAGSLKSHPRNPPSEESFSSGSGGAEGGGEGTREGLVGEGRARVVAGMPRGTSRAVSSWSPETARDRRASIVRRSAHARSLAPVGRVRRVASTLSLARPERLSEMSLSALSYSSAHPAGLPWLNNGTPFSMARVIRCTSAIPTVPRLSPRSAVAGAAAMTSSNASRSAHAPCDASLFWSAAVTPRSRRAEAAGDATLMASSAAVLYTRKHSSVLPLL
mmetsp:Transcript_20723/g.50110  ORF Transcript_20723/g.50110 Transcript_20723/m.50110 type:complete len:230 (+) Transcript_20723:651-1340(+)